MPKLQWLLQTQNSLSFTIITLQTDNLQVFSSAFVTACFLVYPAVFSWTQRPQALRSYPLSLWSVGDHFCLKAVIVSIPQDSSWCFSFKLPKPWQWLVIVSKEVEVVGLENVSVWCDSCSPSEMVFFLLDCAPDSFYSFCYLHGKCYRQQESQRKIVSPLHCNMFSCLETPPVVLRTGCLSINFPQYKIYRVISLCLWTWMPISHTERCS